MADLEEIINNDEIGSDNSNSRDSGVDINDGETANLHKTSGMGVIVTGLFIVGEMAGAGIIAMPEAMLFSSWAGIPLILSSALTLGYTAVRLGWCWTFLQERWPVYRQRTRKPYPSIGERAFGVWMKHFVSACIDATLFGVAVVFLLIASTNIHNLIKSWSSGNVAVSFCLFIIILAAFLLPVTYLGSPKDFWPFVVIAMVCTSVAAVLIVAGAGVDGSKNGLGERIPLKFTQFFLAFGTILFSFGGHAAFPTIQHDMKQPTRFPSSILIAYTIVTSFYLPVALIGFLVYGESVGGNILISITTTWCRNTVILLITFHVILSFVIVVNPLNQEIEEVFNIPHTYNWKRFVSRTVSMLSIVFVAETVPHFNFVLGLIGGSTVGLLTIVFPCLFYMKLQLHIYHANWRSIFAAIPWYEVMINVIIIAIGIILVIVSTYSAIRSLINPPHGRAFTVPCYVNFHDAN